LTLAALLVYFKNLYSHKTLNPNAVNTPLPTSIIALNKKTKVNAHEVTLLEGDINYTTVHFYEGNSLVVAVTLKKIEPLLKELDFIRIHKKFVLNLHYANQSVLNKGTITLQNNIEIKVSRRKRVELKRKLTMSQVYQTVSENIA
jgi:DNA-binding LytR/AlgR family response regulator